MSRHGEYQMLMLQLAGFNAWNAAGRPGAGRTVFPRSSTRGSFEQERRLFGVLASTRASAPTTAHVLANFNLPPSSPTHRKSAG